MKLLRHPNVLKLYQVSLQPGPNKEKAVPVFHEKGRILPQQVHYSRFISILCLNMANLD